MERMPPPPRALSSFCQPLSRPDRADTSRPRRLAGSLAEEVGAVVEREPCHATHRWAATRMLREDDGFRRLRRPAAGTCHLIIF
jgi:hypothetical protein